MLSGVRPRGINAHSVSSQHASYAGPNFTEHLVNRDTRALVACPESLSQKIGGLEYRTDDPSNNCPIDSLGCLWKIGKGSNVVIFSGITNHHTRSLQYYDHYITLNNYLFILF